MTFIRIHTKFLVLVLGILVLSLGFLSTLIVRREGRILVRKNAEQENLVARTIVADLEDSMLTGRPRSTLSLLDSLRDGPGLVRIEVLRRDGTPAFGEKRPTVSLPEVAQSFSDGRERERVEPGASPVHMDIVPLKNEGACLRCHAKAGPVLGVVLLAHSREDTVTEIRDSKRQLIVLLAGAILVMGVALYIAIGKTVLAPLRRLHAGADLLGKGDLGQHIRIDSGDEFQDMASAFNAMADRVRESRANLENMVKLRTSELNESVRLMRGILTSMSSGVVLLDRQGHVKLINRQGAWILGHGHGNLLGARLADVVPEAAGFLSARVGGYEEIMIRGHEGKQVPLGFTLSYYTGPEGQQEGLIVVFQDLTELKALQKELLVKERFASVGRVVAGVAHEIRNPLFGISAIAQIFERDLKEQSQQELSRALLGETRRLNQLVDELLIYGKPLSLKLETADLRVLWEEVLDMHREELQRKKLLVHGDYAVRHPLAQFDVNQVRQVFLNLLRNAIEATNDGDSISITMLIEDRFILFRVADTGMGIPADQLEHVFDLFYTTKPKGTGLGLAICRKIMEDHGGDIDITSMPGTGTVVTVRLPYRPPEELKADVA